ncbi:GNAT family N-acetyltransferase [Nitrosomonas cryotolerans]
MQSRKFQHVVINAQIDAIRFYKKFEFRIAGKRFIEAGIPHVQMILKLQELQN